jgi:hypothetical protein
MPVSIFPAISPVDWDPAEWDDTVALLRKYHVKKFILCPEHWDAYPNIKLDWKKVRFNQAEMKKKLPDKPGLYSFLLQPNVAGHNSIQFLLYIGETTKQTLKDRCRDYLPEAKKKNARVTIRSMVRKWPKHLWVYFAAIDDVTLIKQLEEDLLKAYIPPFNQRYTATVGKTGTLEGALKEVFE